MSASIRKKKPGKGKPAADVTGGSVDALEKTIYERYAAVEEGGRMRRCGPNPDEDPEEHWRWAGNDGKPLMRDQEAAEACAAQLGVATRRPHHAYVCPRSRSGHWHVAAGQAGRSVNFVGRRAAR